MMNEQTSLMDLIKSVKDVIEADDISYPEIVRQIRVIFDEWYDEPLITFPKDAGQLVCFGFSKIEEFWKPK